MKKNHYPYTELIVMAITLFVIIILGLFIMCELSHDPLQPIETRMSNDGSEMQKVTEMIQEGLKKGEQK